jgi:hypothetical protein
VPFSDTLSGIFHPHKREKIKSLYASAEQYLRGILENTPEGIATIFNTSGLALQSKKLRDVLGFSLYIDASGVRLKFVVNDITPHPTETGNSQQR